MPHSSPLDDPTWRPTTVSDIETNEVADGYIVYQPAKDRVHYLNHTAAMLLDLCNGRNALHDLPELMRLAFELSEPPVEEVRGSLELLLNEGLVS